MVDIKARQEEEGQLKGGGSDKEYDDPVVLKLKLKYVHYLKVKHVMICMYMYDGTFLANTTKVLSLKIFTVYYQYNMHVLYALSSIHLVMQTCKGRFKECKSKNKSNASRLWRCCIKERVRGTTSI